MKAPVQRNKNGIKQLQSPNNRTALMFDIDPATRQRLRNVAELTGISQRAILEAGAKRQLREIERQIEKGDIWLTEPQQQEG